MWRAIWKQLGVYYPVYIHKYIKRININADLYNVLVNNKYYETLNFVHGIDDRFRVYWRKKAKLGAYAMKRVDADAHLPTLRFF